MALRPLAILVVTTALLSPALASAQGTPQTLTDLASLILTLFGAATGLLIAFAVVIYFYGIFSNMHAFTEGNPEKFRTYFFWGLVALFVMVSIWGILNMLSQTVFNGNPPGTSSG
jgi:hypothetical protein